MSLGDVLKVPAASRLSIVRMPGKVLPDISDIGRIVHEPWQGAEPATQIALSSAPD